MKALTIEITPKSKYMWFPELEAEPDHRTGSGYCFICEKPIPAGEHMLVAHNVFYFTRYTANGIGFTNGNWFYKPRVIR